jgi:hypothetical protein
VSESDQRRVCETGQRKALASLTAQWILCVEPTVRWTASLQVSSGLNPLTMKGPPAALTTLESLSPWQLSGSRLSRGIELLAAQLPISLRLFVCNVGDSYRETLL